MELRRPPPPSRELHPSKITSMELTVRESPAGPPLLETDKATWIELRDKEGFLVVLTLIMPDRQSFLITTRQDADFAETASNFGIPLKKAAQQ